jgi:MFS family permease
MGVSSIRKLFSSMIEKRRVAAAGLMALSDEEKSIRRGRRNFAIDHISLYIIVSICAGSYLAGLLRYVGVPAELNGLILAIPVLAGFFQVFGAAVAQRLDAKKPFVLTGILIHRICLALVFLYPIFFGAGIVSIVLIVTTYALGFFAGTAVGPAASHWLISLVPTKLRGSYFSMRERYSLLGVALATMLAGMVLDQSESAGIIVWGFAGIGVFLLLVSLVDIIIISRIDAPSHKATKKKFSLSDLMIPIKDQKFFKVILIFVLWQASTQIVIPFLGIYYIDDIGMEYTLIGFITLVITFEKAVIVSRWGRFADKTSWDYVLKFAVAIFAISNLIMIFMTPGNYLVLFPLAAIVGNIAWSVLGISLINLQFQFSDPENTTLYVGVCGTISGVAGFLFALLGSGMLSTLKKMNFFINGNRVLLLISAMIALLLSIYIHRTMKHKKLELPVWKEKNRSKKV